MIKGAARRNAEEGRAEREEGHGGTVGEGCGGVGVEQPGDTGDGR